MQLSDDEKRELAEVYERAAEYLEEHGWKQGDLGFEGEARCFLGGVESALNMKYGWDIPHPIANLAWNFPVGVLELEYKGPGHRVGIWNDEPDRTADEVINTLHALANKLR